MNKIRFRDVVVFVCRHWRRRPWLVAGAYGTMLAATLCDVFIPVIAGNLIDALSAKSVAAALWALAAFVGLSAAFYGLREASYRFWIPLATKVMRQILSDAFWRVQRFGTDWHANSFAGATVRKISRGMWAYDDFADTIYIGFLPAAVVLVGVTANLFWRWPLMGAFLLAAILVYCALSVALVMGYVAPANRRMNDADLSRRRRHGRHRHLQRGGQGLRRGATRGPALRRRHRNLGGAGAHGLDAGDQRQRPAVAADPGTPGRAAGPRPLVSGRKAGPAPAMSPSS